jgi:GGDEF domain-containing protein
MTTLILQSPRRSLWIGGALLAVIAIAVALFTGHAAIGAMVTVACAACLAAGADAAWRRPQPDNSALLTKVGGQIESGRRLVIYERETGLFAHWYVTLRGQEECDRAKRYGHRLSVLLVEPEAGDDPWMVQANLSSWISAHLRRADIAGYLGNGRHVVVLPETNADGAREAIRRLTESVPRAQYAVSAFPDDGTDFEELYRSAAARFGETVEPEADSRTRGAA